MAFLLTLSASAIASGQTVTISSLTITEGNSTNYSTTLRNAMLSAINTIVSTNSTLTIKTTGGTLLSVHSMPTAAPGGTPTNGIWTAGTIQNGTASNTGQPGTWQINSSGGTVIVQGTVTF